MSVRLALASRRSPLASAGRRLHSTFHATGPRLQDQVPGRSEDAKASAEAEGMERADRITKAGALANVGMAGVKAVAGTVAGSPALLADAVHSLSDLLSDGVSLWAVRKAREPANSTHPYGHGKFEAVGSACVGGLLISAGAGIGMHAVQAAVEACSAAAPEPTSLTLQLGAASVAAISVGVKEVLYQRTMVVAQDVRSSTLAANAWHHRTDALSSVVALAGILGSACGASFLDPVAGVLVSGLILKEGASTGRQALRELTDTQVDEELLEQVAGAAGRVPEVLWLSDLRGRVLGPHLLVDMCVGIDPLMSASVAQQVAARVRLEVTGAVPQVSELIVHFNTDVEPGRGARQPLCWDERAELAGARLRREGVKLKPLSLHEHRARQPPALAPCGPDEPGCLEPPDRLMRPEAEIRADVRAALSSLPEVWGVSHIHLLWDAARGGAVVQANLILDPNMRVLQAMRVGGSAKIALERLSDVLEADLHLELLLPCHMWVSRDLVPGELALPTTQTRADAAAAAAAAGVEHEGPPPDDGRKLEERQFAAMRQFSTGVRGLHIEARRSRAVALRA